MSNKHLATTKDDQWPPVCPVYNFILIVRQGSIWMNCTWQFEQSNLNLNRLSKPLCVIRSVRNWQQLFCAQNLRNSQPVEKIKPGTQYISQIGKKPLPGLICRWRRNRTDILSRQHNSQLLSRGNAEEPKTETGSWFALKHEKAKSFLQHFQYGYLWRWSQYYNLKHRDSVVASLTVYWMQLSPGD